MSVSQIVAGSRRAPGIWAKVAGLCNLECEQQVWNPLRDLLAASSGPLHGDLHHLYQQESTLRDQLHLIIDCCIASMAVPQLASMQAELLSGRSDLAHIMNQVHANGRVQALAPSAQLVRILTVQRLGNVLVFLRLADNQSGLALACSEAFEAVASWRSGEYSDFEVVLDWPELAEQVLSQWLSPQQAWRLVALNTLRIAGVKATATAAPVIDVVATDVTGDMQLLYEAVPSYPGSLPLGMAETILAAGRVWTGCVWSGHRP